jgi:hypothetical protein
VGTTTHFKPLAIGEVMKNVIYMFLIVIGILIVFQSFAAKEIAQKQLKAITFYSTVEYQLYHKR